METRRSKEAEDGNKEKQRNGGRKLGEGTLKTRWRALSSLKRMLSRGVDLAVPLGVPRCLL
jgi:hypothetical protein